MESKLNKLVDKYFGENRSSYNKKKQTKISAPYDVKHLGRVELINKNIIKIPEEWKKILNLKKDDDLEWAKVAYISYHNITKNLNGRSIKKLKNIDESVDLYDEEEPAQEAKSSNRFSTEINKDIENLETFEQKKSYFEKFSKENKIYDFDIKNLKNKETKNEDDNESKQNNLSPNTDEKLQQAVSSIEANDNLRDIIKEPKTSNLNLNSQIDSDENLELKKNMDPKEAKSILEKWAKCENLNDKYDFNLQSDKIGCGASGNVFKGKNKLNQQLYALKQINWNKQIRKDLILSEIKILKDLNHSNLVNYIECYFISNELWIIMEFLDFGPLTDIVARLDLSEDHIATISREILSGISYLHQNKIIHRDIKSDNVLVGLNGSIKLGDFGYCAYITKLNDKRFTFAGTPCWIAPEIARNRPYCKKIDVWSFGITVIEMITNEPPYMNENSARVIYLIACNGKPTIEEKYLNRMCDEFKHFLFRCLEDEPTNRADTDELLNSEFIKNYSKTVDTLKPIIELVLNS